MSALKFEIDVGHMYDKLLDDQVLPFKQKVAMQVLRGVVLKTPVDTGRAKGNWHVTLSGISDAVFAATDKVGTSAIARGVAAISGDRDPFQAVHVQNNLPYIQALEGGHSQIQAPLGMVAVTVVEIQVQF